MKKYLALSALIAVLLLPALFLTDASFTYYSPEVSALKVAFKHSGKRVVQCDEGERIKAKAREFRKKMKDEGMGVKMDLSTLGECPRERHPVSITLTLDDVVMIDKDYHPAGIKKDMASFINEHFIIASGLHHIKVSLRDAGPGEGSGLYTLEEIVELAPGEVLLVRYDPKTRALVLE